MDTLRKLGVGSKEKDCHLETLKLLCVIDMWSLGNAAQNTTAILITPVFIRNVM